MFSKIVTNSVWQGCRIGAGFLALFLSPKIYAKSPSQILEIIRKIPHSGYSEGLDFHEGFLWHALPKEIVKIDPKDGQVLARFSPASEYSESIKWFKGSLWNLSFSDNGLYQGELKKDQFLFKKVGTLPEPHGWGIEQVGNELVVSGNFSSHLYFYDPQKLKWGRVLKTEASEIEDLAWDGEWLWSSSFSSHSGKIFVLDIKTGKIQSFWELPEKDQCPVIDGIALQGKTFWITGKDCPSIYQVKIPKQRTLTSESPKK